MQGLAWTLSLALMAGIAIIFLRIVAEAAQPGGDAGVIAKAAYRWRDRMFWITLASGVAVSFATLWQWPIPGHAAKRAQPDVIVQAVGHLWRWELDRNIAQRGQLVEFQVTASDVNHGFAIYTPDRSRILTQAQAMPGYTNRLQVRFDEVGDYEILCLEYCGLAHHAMRAVFKVRED